MLPGVIDGEDWDNIEYIVWDFDGGENWILASDDTTKWSVCSSTDEILGTLDEITGMDGSLTLSKRVNATIHGLFKCNHFQEWDSCPDK